jgi:vacuolar-type H+-ATPase subunit H
MNVNVTVHQPLMEEGSAIRSTGEKMESKQGEDNSMSFKQILSSLAETKKYLPQQVNTFLDSMEGKTIDDLRFEAMHLANKAQEEAKRKTTETVDNVKQKAQDITDMAKSRTSDMKQKGVDMVNNVVQPPLQATQNTTKNLASAVNEKTTGLMSKGLDYTKSTIIPMLTPYAVQAKTTVTPYAEKLVPYAKQAKQYLPPGVKTFVETNVEGKSPEELGKFALGTTRKELLNAKNEKEIPSLGQLVGEVKQATLSGNLFYNVLGVSEKTANAFFGDTKVPKDAGLIRRIYNLNYKVNRGIADLTWQQLNNARHIAMDMTNQRLNQTKEGIYSRAGMMKERMTPLMTRIGQTPLVPSFVFKFLRGEMPSQSGTSAGFRMGMEETKGKAPEGGAGGLSKSTNTQTTSNMAPTAAQAKVSVKVDVAPADAPQATTTSKQTATTSATVASGGSIGNTNAQGLGDLGKAGMGITTTGGETKITEHEESNVPPTDEASHGHKKKKQQNKL